MLEDCKEELAKAKAIFTYIQKNIQWNNYYGKYAEYGIKKALEKHSDNIGDIEHEQESLYKTVIKGFEIQNLND